MRSICYLVICLLVSVSAFSQDDINHLLSDLRNAKSDTQRIDSYNDLYNHYSYSNPDSALYYLNEGLELFTEKGNKLGVAEMTSLLGEEDVAQGRMAMGKKKLSEALNMFTELNYTDGIAKVDNSLGVIDGRTGKFDSATKHFMAALKLFEGTSNKKGITATYLKLGVVSEISNNLDKALEYYNMAMAMAKDQPLSPNVVFLYNNIAIVYGKKGNFKKALEYLQLALDKADKPEYAGVRIQSLTNMGIVYDHGGDDKQALKYYNEALQLATEKNLPEERARAIVNIASIYGKTDPAKSIEYLKQALEMAKQIGQRSLELEIYDYLEDNYKQAGNYKEALETLEQQKKLQDSLFSIDKAREIANIQSEFEVEQTNTKMQELQLLGHKNLLQRNIIIVVAFVMAITLIILTFFLRKITRLNEQLFKRETELSKSNTVKDKLFSIIGHDLRGPIGNIPVMLRILQDESTTTEERQYIYETLVEHSQASLETLDKLLYWGQAQLKGIGLKPVDFNPEQYLLNDLQLIKSNTEQKQITINNNLPDNISVHGDPAHFDFIIRNLLSNAVKFTHSGGSVTISANSNSTPSFTVFAITDTGIGIDKAKTTEIFEPFSNSTKGTADERGTSIGLMLCKEFVIENGGNIWVESDPGKGSTFYFSFKTTRSA